MPVYSKKSIILYCGMLDPKSFLKQTGQHDHHFILEGRPSLEAGINNAKLFLKHKLKPTVIADSMAGFLFAQGWVKEVVLACQYVDKTGALCDTGALICAVLAKTHGVKVRLVTGKRKPHFLGNPEDMTKILNHQVAPRKTKAFVPLVEWVDKKYL